MRMVKESQKNQETKIRVGGSVPYSSILEDYQNGEFKCEKKTLTETLRNLGFYTENFFVRCDNCGSFINAKSKNKKYCKECAAKTKKEQNRQWIKDNYEQQLENIYRWNIKNVERKREKQKEWFKRFDDLYIYYLIDVSNNIKYIGKCKNIYIRARQHLGSHNIETKEFIESDQFKKLVFIPLSDIIENDDELLKLESLLIDKYKNNKLINKFETCNVTLDLKRLGVVNEIANNLNIEDMFEWD